MVLLSREPSVEERIHLLKAGFAAIFGPSDPPALIAAYAAAIRRRADRPCPVVAETTGLRVLRDRREAQVGDQAIMLRETPYRLLTVLAQRFGKIVHSDVLEQLLPRCSHGGRKALRVHLSVLRRCLGKHGFKIQAEPGIGYRLVA